LRRLGVFTSQEIGWEDVLELTFTDSPYPYILKHNVDRTQRRSMTKQNYDFEITNNINRQYASLYNILKKQRVIDMSGFPS